MVVLDDYNYKNSQKTIRMEVDDHLRSEIPKWETGFA